MNIGIYSLEKNVIVKKIYIEINYNVKENRCFYQFMNKDINVIYNVIMYNQENYQVMLMYMFLLCLQIFLNWMCLNFYFFCNNYGFILDY